MMLHVFHIIIGKPLDRADGRLKVTGGARYSGPGDSNMYVGRIIQEGPLSNHTVTAEIWKNVNGVWTMLASRTGVAYAGSFKFVVVGSSLDLIIGAVDVHTTDMSIVAAGTTGVRTTAGTSLTLFEAR